MKKLFFKRLAAVLLAACLCISELGSVLVYASGIVEIESSETEMIYNEPATETEAVTETETATETEDETETRPAILPETEAEAEIEVQTITGFVGLSDIDRRLDISEMDKPSLRELVSLMPKTLKVYLNGSKKVSEISVSWYCVGENYEKSDSHYFQFSPSLDEGKYVLSEKMNALTDIPYIGVFLAEGDGIMTMAASSNTSANETEIFYFLINEMGLNQAAASGILANIYRESGFNPTVNGDNGTSYGICQWRNSRKTNLINYCKQKGYDYTSLTGQLYFLKYELETSYPQIYTYMRNAANTEQGAYLAGYYWCYNFEIPANTENTSIERGNLAKVIYWPKYKNVDSVPRISEVKNVSTGVQVKWTEVKDANGYYIYRRTSQDGAWQMIHKTAKGTVGSYTDKNVISSKTYTYAVVAYFESDDAMVTTSEMSDEESILYLAMPEVTGASIVNSGVKVTWNKVSGAKGYYIYRKTATSDYVRIAKVSGGSSEVYTDKTVESGITYTYTVRAYASDAWGSCNSNATVKYLESPEIVSAQVVKNGIKLTWTEVKGATYYYVYRKNDGERYTRIAKVSKESIVTYTDTTAVSGTTYTYTVRACANDAWGCCNSTASVGYLAAPNVTSAKVVSNGIKVNWQKVSGAKGYYVYRKTAGKGWTRIAKIASASAVNYTDTTVESGIVYTYMVRAYSGSIAGNYNKQVSNMYLTQPSLSSATIVNNNDIKVTWKQVAGAKGYYVYRKTEGSGWTRIAKVSKAATVSYTDTTAASGTAYTYTVRAFNGTYGSAYDAAGVSCKLPQKLILYKTTDKLNYRTGPGTTYTVSGTLNRDVTVQVVSGYSSTANGNTWYKIYLNNQYYYVSASYLKKYKS